MRLASIVAVGFSRPSSTVFSPRRSGSSNAGCPWYLDPFVVTGGIISVSRTETFSDLEEEKTKKMSEKSAGTRSDLSFLSFHAHFQQEKPIYRVKLTWFLPNQVKEKWSTLLRILVLQAHQSYLFCS